MIMRIKQLRCALITWSTHRLLLPIIRLLISPPPFPYNMEMLQNMPPDTTGALLHQFLMQHRLQLLKDYETHDIKHVLLEYPPDEQGEACLQYFMFGNGQQSFPVLITVLVTLVIMPDYHRSFRAAYARGKASKHVGDTDWIAMMPMNASEARKLIGLAAHKKSGPLQPANRFLTRPHISIRAAHR